MAEAIPTWAEVYEQMRADFASGAWRTMSGYSVPGGTSVQYRSFAEFKAMMEYVGAQADAEAGAPARRRTSARAKGRWS